MDDRSMDWKMYETYMNDGYKRPAAVSSELTSSSVYLNDYRIREWTATQCLRRNGPDLPVTYGQPTLNVAFEEAQDQDYINQLFEEARKDWPELDQFLEERFLSRWMKKDLEHFPKGSLGNVVWAHFDKYGYDNTMSSMAMPVTNHYEFFRRRKVEIHDFMHVLTGAGFDYIAEGIPNFIHFGSFHKYFKPQLAHQLTVSNILLFFPFFFRCSLNYAEGFPWFWEAMNKGVDIGRQSGPYFLKKIEDYLHLSVEEARDALEIRGAEDVDFDEWKRRSDVVMEGGQSKTETMAAQRAEMIRNVTAQAAE
jgi:ubiquinone biosynthesis protein COQ4